MLLIFAVGYHDVEPSKLVTSRVAKLTTMLCFSTLE